MDKRLIIKEIKKQLNIEKDKDFAEYLGIKTSTLSMWYKRNSYDIELLFKKCEFVNAEWLLTGKGEMLKKEYQKDAKEKTKSKKNVIISNDNINDNVNDTKRKVKKMLSNEVSEPQPYYNSQSEVIQLLKENKKLVEKHNSMLEKEVCRLTKRNEFLEQKNKSLILQITNLEAEIKELKVQLKTTQNQTESLKKELQKVSSG